jgi:hypothetical protein
MLELIPCGICGVMSGLGVCDILARRVFRLAKAGDSDQAYELFQVILPQIVFCLQNLELYHHAEKLLIEARGVISGPVVRQVPTLFVRVKQSTSDSLTDSQLIGPFWPSEKLGKKAAIVPGTLDLRDTIAGSTQCGFH